MVLGKRFRKEPSDGDGVQVFVLFDQHSVFQVGLASYLEQLFPSTTIISSETVRDLESSLDQHPGAVLFLGQVSLESGVIAAAERMQNQVVWIAHPLDEVMAISTHPVVKAIIYRTATPTEVFACIEALKTQQKWVQVRVKCEDDKSGDLASRLTQKELRIVSYLYAGKRNREIAAMVGTTEQRIKNQLGLIYDKLGVQGRVDAVRLLSLNPPTCAHLSVAASQ